MHLSVDPQNSWIDLTKNEKARSEKIANWYLPDFVNFWQFFKPKYQILESFSKKQIGLWFTFIESWFHWEILINGHVIGQELQNLVATPAFWPHVFNYDWAIFCLLPGRIRTSKFWAGVQFVWATDNSKSKQNNQVEPPKRKMVQRYNCHDWI